MANGDRDALGFTQEERRRSLDSRIRDRVDRQRESSPSGGVSSGRSSSRDTDSIPVSIRQQEETVRQQERAIERLGESPDRLSRLRSAQEALDRLERERDLGLRQDREVTVETPVTSESTTRVTRRGGETVSRESIRLADGTTIVLDRDPTTGTILDRRTISDGTQRIETTGLTPGDLRTRERVADQILSDLRMSRDRVNLETGRGDIQSVVSPGRRPSFTESTRIARERLDRGIQPLDPLFDGLQNIGLGGVSSGLRSGLRTGVGVAGQQTILGTGQVVGDTIGFVTGGVRGVARSGRRLVDDRTTSFPFFLPTPREVGSEAAEFGRRIPGGIDQGLRSIGGVGTEIRRDPGLGAGLILTEVGTGVLPISGVRGSRLARSTSFDFPSVNIGTRTRGRRQVILGGALEDALSGTTGRDFTRLTPTELRSLGIRGTDQQLTLTGGRATVPETPFATGQFIPTGVDEVTGRVRFSRPDSFEGRRALESVDPRVRQTGLRQFGVRDPVYIQDRVTGQIIVRDARLVADFVSDNPDRFRVLGRSPTPTPVVRRRRDGVQQTLQESLGVSTTRSDFAFATLLPLTLPRRRDLVRDRNLFRRDRTPTRRILETSPVSRGVGVGLPSISLPGFGLGSQGLVGDTSLRAGVGVGLVGDSDLNILGDSSLSIGDTSSLSIASTNLTSGLSRTGVASGTRSLSRSASSIASVSGLVQPLASFNTGGLSTGGVGRRPGRRRGGVPRSSEDDESRDGSGLFRVFTRRRGRKVLVGSSDDLDEAFGLGVGKVQSTLRASFKVETDDPLLQDRVDRRKRDLAGGRSFRFGKTLPGWLVEPRSERLSSREEVSSIQSKRRNRSRGSGGLSLDNGFFSGGGFF